MCLICIEYQKGNLTLKEVARNSLELPKDEQEHVINLIAEVAVKEDIEKILKGFLYDEQEKAS